jgi:S1-C subfamily serine protease
VYVYDENHGTVKYGDRILTVDGVNISSSAEVIAIAAGKRVGDTLTLEVVRKGDVKTLTVTIAEKRPAAKNADE